MNSQPKGFETLERFYRSHAANLRRALGRQVGDAELGEDLAHDTFVRALQTCERLDASRPTWPWINTIAQRVVVDEIVRRKHVPTVPFDSVPDTELARVMPTSDPAASSADPIEALMALTPRERKAIFLHMIGFDRQEIADREGIGTRGADSLLSRARGIVRAAIYAQINEVDRRALGLARSVRRSRREIADVDRRALGFARPGRTARSKDAGARTHDSGAVA